MKKLYEINGYEIIEFLNSLFEDTNLDLQDDYNICPPCIFESQEIIEGKYSLIFSAYYNNWGTHQLIDGNEIIITEDLSISIVLDEAFEGTSLENKLEVLINKFIISHKFNQNVSDEYNCIIAEVRDDLIKISYNDKELLSNIIEKLTRAKTLMK